jgi:hypothetical protein
MVERPTIEYIVRILSQIFPIIRSTQCLFNKIFLEYHLFTLSFHLDVLKFIRIPWFQCNGATFEFLFNDNASVFSADPDIPIFHSGQVSIVEWKNRIFPFTHCFSMTPLDLFLYKKMEKKTIALKQVCFIAILSYYRLNINSHSKEWD